MSPKLNLYNLVLSFCIIGLASQIGGKFFYRLAVFLDADLLPSGIIDHKVMAYHRIIPK